MSETLDDLFKKLATVPEWSDTAETLREQIARAVAVERAVPRPGIEIIADDVAVRLPKPPVTLPPPEPARIEFSTLTPEQVRRALSGAERAGIPRDAVLSALVGLENSLATGSRRTFPADAQGQRERESYQRERMAEYEVRHGKDDRPWSPVDPGQPGAASRKAAADSFWTALGLASVVNEGGLGNDPDVWDNGHRGWSNRSTTPPTADA